MKLVTGSKRAPKSTQNRSKIYPKTFENRAQQTTGGGGNAPKKSRNRCQEGPKSSSGGGLEGVRAGLGGVLGPRCLQDAFRAPFGTLRGRFWAPSWGQVGGQKGTKIEAKSSRKSIWIWMPLGMGFWWDFGGSWGPKWSQVGPQNGSKIGPNIERRFFQKVLSGTTKNIIFSIKLRFRGSKTLSKLDQKSIKKWHPK